MTTKINQIKQRRADQKKRQWIITFTILVVGLLFITGLIFYPKFAPVSDVKTPVTVMRPNPLNNSMGDPAAKVKVEELADFQCPACTTFSQLIEPKIIDTYVTTGKVYFTFRPFAFLGTESTDAAKASYCAMGQGKFWEYHDTLYANQTGENIGDFAPRKLQAFASANGMDLDKFNVCMKNPETDQKVKDDVIYGREKGISGTPSFFVNGNLVMLEGLVQEIEKAISLN